MEERKEFIQSSVERVRARPDDARLEVQMKKLPATACLQFAVGVVAGARSDWVKTDLVVEIVDLKRYGW